MIHSHLFLPSQAPTLLRKSVRVSGLPELLSAFTNAGAKTELLRAIDGSERGVNQSSRPSIEAAVDKLAVRSAPNNTDARLLSAEWRLLWTSERETLFLLANGLPFVGAAADVFQVVDVASGRIQNCVAFGEYLSAAFVVDGTLKVASSTRCDFAFSSASFRRESVEPFVFPPFGRGWFDTLYVDADLRVARDSRGDTLVVQRSKLPPSLRRLLA